MEDLNHPWRDIKTRGLTLIQFQKYINKTLGHNEAEAIFYMLHREYKYKIKNIQKSSWYPFELQRLLREAIIARINPSDPLGVIYRMGLVTATWDFSGFLKPLFSFISRKSILNHSANLWGKYYNRGIMKVVDYNDNQGFARIELDDFPADPHFYPLVTSWMKVALDVLKSPSPRIEYSQHPDTDSSMRFDLYWETG